MATKSKARAPAKAQPKTETAQRVADDHDDPINADRFSPQTCPIRIDGPGKDRIELANSAAHQAGVILGKLLDMLEDSFIDDDEVIPRALISRAYVLVDAAGMLLSDPSDVEGLVAAEVAVSHG